MPGETRRPKSFLGAAHRIVAGTVGGTALLDVTGLNVGSYSFVAEFTDAAGNVETRPSPSQSAKPR